MLSPTSRGTRGTLWLPSLLPEKGKGSRQQKCKKLFFVGYVLSQNFDKQRVDLPSAKDWIQETFGIALSRTTVWTYLHELGFSSRKMSVKSRGFTKTDGQLATECVTWIQEQRKAGRINGLTASIDFTYTSHRNDHVRGFVLRGISTQMFSGLSRYTNCIVTCEWSDGVNRTPAMLFTYNPDFRLDRKATGRRLELAAHFKTCLERSNIQSDRVIYIGKSTGEKRTYVAESTDLVRRFFKLYGVGCEVIFSDGGNSLLEQGKSVLLDVRFKDHVVYPADIHQFLSPNDNKLHGAAKQKWRQSSLDYKDDVQASLTLLQYLDDVPASVRKRWWRHNLMMGGKVSLKRALEIVSGRKTARDLYHHKCYKFYKQWVKELSQ